MPLFAAHPAAAMYIYHEGKAGLRPLDGSLGMIEVERERPVKDRPPIDEARNDYFPEISGVTFSRGISIHPLNILSLTGFYV
jgi:hypothetical protein